MLILAEKFHLEPKDDSTTKRRQLRDVHMLSQAPNVPPCPNDLRAELRSFLGYPLMSPPGGGGALGYFWGEDVPPGTLNWHPVLKKISPRKRL